MAGERRLHRDLRGLAVADLADEHDIRVLPQDGASAAAKVSPAFSLHLHLHDVLAQPVFDRVFHRDDVHTLVLHHAGGRSTASSSCPSRWAR